VGIFIPLFFIDAWRLTVTQIKLRAMRVWTEKAIALREKPPFDKIKLVLKYCQLLKLSKGGFKW